VDGTRSLNPTEGTHLASARYSKSGLDILGVKVYNRRLIRGGGIMKHEVATEVKNLKRKKKGLLHDARSIAKRDPAAKSVLSVIFLYPGFHALIWHRISHRFYLWKRYFIARMISQYARFLTGIEIHPGAKIGNGLFIDHGMGVVIGETAEVGNNCTIYHEVTLGGTGKDKGKRHPTVGDNVLIGAGAKLLGPFLVGDNAMIGAGAVVLDEVEANATVAGIKARVVKRLKRRDEGTECFSSEELDQIHMPDPIALEICKLTNRIEHLEKKLSETGEDRS